MSDPIAFFPNAGIQFVFGDLAQIRSELDGYELAGIQSIVNVLGGQYAENKSYREQSIETEYFSDRENESFNETSRSESTSESVRSAVQSQASRSSNFSASVEGEGNWGVARVSAGVSYNNSKSKSQSKADAQSFARQVVESATNSVRSRIQSGMNEKRLTKEIEEQVRGLDNRGGDASAMLIRYVEERWRYELVQHKKHLFTRVIIPKPAANYLNALDERAAGKDAASQQLVPFKFTDPVSQQEKILSPNSISPDNWFQLAALFEVSEPILPPTAIVKTHCWSDSTNDKPRDHFIQKASIPVPEGLRPKWVKVSSHITVAGEGLDDDQAWKTTSISLLIGGYRLQHKHWDQKSFSNGFHLFNVHRDYENLELALLSVAQNVGNIGVDIVFEPTKEALEQWKLAFYQQLLDAHNGSRRKSPAEQFDLISVADLSGSPTAAERMIRTQLEALALQYVCGTNLNGLGGVDRESANFPDYPVLDHARINGLQPVLSFLSGAFDFEKMTYRFLPHYLGDREQRSMAFKGGTNGKLDEFVQAGAVELILPVSHGIEEQLLYFMQTGLIIEGNDIPLPLNPDMLALYEEVIEARLMEQQDEPIVLDSWTDNLPTTHVMLQDGAQLPDFGQGGVNPGPVEGNRLTAGSDPLPSGD